MFFFVRGQISRNLGNDATDRRGILRDGRAVSRTCLLLFFSGDIFRSLGPPNVMSERRPGGPILASQRPIFAI